MVNKKRIFATALAIALLLSACGVRSSEDGTVDISSMDVVFYNGGDGVTFTSLEELENYLFIE